MNIPNLNTIKTQDRDHARTQVNDQIWSQVRNQFRSQVEDQVWNQIGDAQIRSRVIDQVNVESKILGQSKIRSQIRTQVSY